MTELTGKQKRYLRALGVQIKPTISVGKAGVTENTYLSVNNGFNTKELLKIKIQDGCELERDEVAGLLTKRTGSLLVQIIGNTLLLYKRDRQNPKLHLPDQPS